MNFKTFLNELKPGVGVHGENTNDAPEKTMINKIIAVKLDGKRTPENYKIAYDFLESDWGGFIWDKYYELFKQKSPDFEGPVDIKKFTAFSRDTRAAFNSWKKGAPYSGPKVSD